MVYTLRMVPYMHLIADAGAKQQARGARHCAIETLQITRLAPTKSAPVILDTLHESDLLTSSRVQTRILKPDIRCKTCRLAVLGAHSTCFVLMPGSELFNRAGEQDIG